MFLGEKFIMSLLHTGEKAPFMMKDPFGKLNNPLFMGLATWISEQINR
jgi:hypothetical protein